MDRRQFLAASSVGLAAAAAGCTGSPLSSDETDSTDPGSAADEASNDGEITVSASGEVETAPDKAIADVGVEASGETADEVTEALSTGAEQLRTAFDDLGIPDENVEEGQYRVYPRRGRDGESEGFRGVHSFEVTLTDTDRVGEVIDASVDAGADTVGRVNFTLQEETRSELRKDAIDAALANADEEASHIADNREVELEGTTAVTTGDVQVHSVRRETMAADDAASGAAPPTEIDADPVTVSASATVTYSFPE
ncbi:SIMPL domain-containing protein [Natrinema sp. SYSU A 869]|uniref:SIMPL domain-containing protein n=1 Tax=Natrinema sp. SYSU A 869 TaxID=2871694 RepID=UPI001CA3BF5E|nr:SIMPL domain-containing protein [Natrinema sp. SYSU A 869]